MFVLSKPSIKIRNSSIPQRLPRLQCELNPFLRLLLSAQRFEPLAFQVEYVLLAYGHAGGDVAAAEDFGDFCDRLYFVVGDVFALGA